MMDDCKILSVITPVFNRADCVGRCMASVAAQDVPQGWMVEHVVVDDGSADATAAEVERHAGPHVSFERLPENRGTNAARNAAMRRARGRWVVLLDSDDEMLPGAVREICGAIDANPDISHFIFSTDDTAADHQGYGAQRIMTFEDFLLRKVKGDFVHVLLRQTILDHPFGEKLRIHEGVFFLHYYRRAGRVMFIGKVLYHRDRERTDHVTFDLDMTNDRALANKRDAARLRIADFEADYALTERGRELLEMERQTVYKLSVLAGDYAEAKEVERRLMAVAPGYALLRRLHCGPMAWRVIKPLVRLKHRLTRG
nr:glycosyltransferase family 2 protein [Bacteroides sp.]